MSTPQPEHIETVIIGAGQAGLATGYRLQRKRRSFVILDSESRIGDGWRHQWDSLRLFTPAWADALPGKPFPAPAWSYPTKEEFADYLESYAAELALPVRLGTHVVRLQAAGAPGVTGQAGTGGDLVTTDRGQIHADNVVVATGTFGRAAAVPGFADQLDPGSSSSTRASTAGRATYHRAGYSWLVPLTRAVTSPTSWQQPTRRSSPGAIWARSPSLSTPAASGSSSHWCCSPSPMCSPGERRSAARRWRRSDSTAASGSGSRRRTSRSGASTGSRTGSPVSRTASQSSGSRCCRRRHGDLVHGLPPDVRVD